MILRAAAVVSVCWVTMIGAPQPAAGRVDPSSVDPEVAISVERLPTGTDMVRVTLLDPQYPAELLREQIAALGERLDVKPRGLNIRYETVGSSNPHTFLEATLVVEGLIDRTEGELRIDPLVDAFLGAPEPYQIESFIITFHGESAGSTTLKAHEDDFVHVEGTLTSAPPAVSYRVLAFSQDPDQIIVPSSYQEPSAGTTGVNRKGQAPTGLIIALLAIGGLAAGVLVYFGLLWAFDRKQS